MRAQPRTAVGGDSQGLSAAVAMRLVGEAGFGRIVFSHHGIPMIRPVNHFVDDETIVVCTRSASRLAACVRGGGDRGVVVAYEAEELGPHLWSGWYVVATGPAYIVTDPSGIARCETRLLPFADGGTCLFIEIEPTTVAGIRFVPAVTDPGCTIDDARSETD